MAQFMLALLRLFAVCVAAASLLATPVAGEAIELEQPVTALCQEGAAAHVAVSPDGPEHEDHEHHKHGCGSCHIHVLRSQVVSLAAQVSPSLKRSLPVMEEPLLAEPTDLFRPPRA